ncbi:MAG TPA: IPT/TIG domain-containing protein [Thermoanaerobaculia bacterium]|nr:IPT/TIG domain-containing protein [Thermoanaerobaculia bacterium]
MSATAERERPRIREREQERPIAEGAVPGVATDEDGPAFARTEEGCVGARVLDYLERHGDYGRIDPEVLLYVTREEHERLERERKGPRANAIGGTVWTSLGPTNGAGRATAVAVHPTTAGTTIIGAAGGGAWKTTNSGTTWTALTETLANLSVGAIAYAPSAPTTVYLGTGEGGYAVDFIPGIGLLKSTNGGTDWTLPSSVIASMFYRLLVHPTNANELVAGTNNGALRSTAGQNGPWTTVIASASTPSTIGYGDVTDIVRHPTDPLILWAATWDRGYYCRDLCSDPFNYNSPTILKSVNGGASWTASATGLPVNDNVTEVDRWSIAVSPSNPLVLYAATSVYDYSLFQRRSRIYKTVNGGTSWTETNLALEPESWIHNYLGQQAWYDNTIIVSPTDPNTVIAGGVTYVKTTDGGANWYEPPGLATAHVDVHDLRYSPAGTLWVANDGGIWTSTDHGETATERNTGLITRQYYAITNDVVNRNRVLGGTQDNGTNSRGDAGGTSWSFFSGGDGFQCEINPAAPGMAFSTYQFGSVNRTTQSGAGTFILGNYSPRYPSSEQRPFFTVLEADPSNPAVLYTTTHRLWKSVSGGEAWVPLPITTSGGGWNASYIRAIAIAASNPQILMVAKGSAVYRSTDGGTTWTPVSTGLPGRTVNGLMIDPSDPNKVFAALAGVSGTSVYYTLNGGTNWSPRGTGLPQFSALVVRDDPTDATTLYCGTDVGVYRSTDGGATWSRFGTGMPAVSVYDIQILNDASILRAGTHGRGIWELNITGNTNNLPSVSVTAPGLSVTVAKGVSLSFAATASDPDGGTPAPKWTFPDDWSSTASTAATHKFHRAGIWPVTFTATDANGGAAGAQVTVTVPEPADDCATPLVVPAAGPFPYTVTLANDVATRQVATDPVTGGSCYPYYYDGASWLSFTPAATGNYQISLCGSRAPAWISAFTGASCGPYTATGFCHLNLTMGDNCGADPIGTTFLTAGTTYRFLVGNYYSGGSPSVTVTITQSTDVTPVVASVDVHDGPTTGGTPVAITGSGFAAGAAVAFGGTAATSVTVLSSNVLTAVTPAHAAGVVNVTVTNSGDTAATLGGGFTYEVVAVALTAPTGFVATATSATSVGTSWNSVAGATSYEIARSSGGAYTSLGTTAALTYPDATAAANTAYLYKVRALGAGGTMSSYSNIDLATTVVFTDDPLAATSTPIKITHLSQLRTAVNAVRTIAALGAFSFTDTVAAGLSVKALHLTQLRTALDAARTILALPAATYTNTLTAGTTKVKAIDFTEVRNGVK